MYFKDQAQDNYFSLLNKEAFVSNDQLDMLCCNKSFIHFTPINVCYMSITFVKMKFNDEESTAVGDAYMLHGRVKFYDHIERVTEKMIPKMIH